jgi:two-component system response regulator
VNSKAGVKSILLVEDDPGDAELTLRAFARREPAIVVTWVQDGVEALEKLAEIDGRGPEAKLPDVILLDLHMPRMDGLELLHRLRSHERTRLVPVVVLTSSNDERELVESYRLGANSFVRRPVDFDEFLEAARQLGVYWLQLNRPPPGSG